MHTFLYFFNSFLLLFCSSFLAMEKPIIAIHFSNDLHKELTCGVFIDENTIAFSGKEKCFIYDTTTQIRTNIMKKPAETFFNMCISPNGCLLGYNDSWRPYMYNIQAGEITSPITHPPYSRNVSIGFCSNNDLIAYENNQYTRFFGNDWAVITPIAAMPCIGHIVCHPKEDNFLVCSKKPYFYLVNRTTNEAIKINTPYCCKHILYSPDGTFIAIANMKKRIFIGKYSAMFENNQLPLQPIGFEDRFYQRDSYETVCFYPKNNGIIALLNKIGSIEYRDFTTNQLLATQKVMNDQIDKSKYQFCSLRFSPRGKNALVIANAQCFLTKVPLSIKYRYEVLMYCGLTKLLPREICSLILNLVDHV